MATATTGTANCYADFDEAPWTGWTSGGANGYLVSSMLTNCGINSTTINTTTTRNNSPGALDVNVTIAAPTGNDFLVMIENGVYPNLNVQFGVNNPSYLSYWVYPTTAAIQTYRLWFNLNGTNIDIGNSGINCPAGTWTNVVVPIPGFVGAMTVLKAVGIDMTCAKATTTDVIYDSICFYQ